MTDGPFDSQKIDNPEICNLLLRISREAIHAVIYSIVEDNSLIYRRIVLDPNSASRLQAIESVIYDNPILLSDFRQVICVIETPELTVVPAECSSESDRQLLFKAAFPDSDLLMEADETGTRNAVILMGIEPDLRGFLNRTFHRVRIMSHLGALCRYFASKSGQGNNLKMVVNARQKSLDVIVLDGHRLLMANTFEADTAENAAYYILACRKQLGLDQHSDELLIAGDQGAREALTPILRTYVARVMPVIFPPQMFKAGKDAMLAPFDLIVTPICE